MRRSALAAALLALVALIATARAESVAEFYHGKQIRFVIGYPTGSGYNM